VVPSCLKDADGARTRSDQLSIQGFYVKIRILSVQFNTQQPNYHLLIFGKTA
jgi:hypothetical protein